MTNTINDSFIEQLGCGRFRKPYCSEDIDVDDSTSTTAGFGNDQGRISEQCLFYHPSKIIYGRETEAKEKISWKEHPGKTTDDISV